MPISWREPGKIGFYAYFYLINGARRMFGDRYVISVFNEKNRAMRPQLIWKIANLSGARLTNKDGAADAVYAHDDETQINGKRPWPTNAINGRCLNIAKTKVEEVFASVFGYSARVDPRAHEGEMVEKSDRNATHDGHVVFGPLANVRNDAVYERLIDNTISKTRVEDLRACIVGNDIPFVYVKHRPIGQRFSNYNSHIEWRLPHQVFSGEEIRDIKQFAKGMCLDLGELDILRDKRSGLIYIVDVAKTPHSPSTQFLSIGGIRCMHRAAAAFRRQYLDARSDSRTRA